MILFVIVVVGFVGVRVVHIDCVVAVVYVDVVVIPPACVRYATDGVAIIVVVVCDIVTIIFVVVVVVYVVVVVVWLC